MILVPREEYYEVKRRFENEPELANEPELIDPPKESWSCNIS